MHSFSRWLARRSILKTSSNAEVLVVISKQSHLLASTGRISFAGSVFATRQKNLWPLLSGLWNEIQFDNGYCDSIPPNKTDVLDTCLSLTILFKAGYWDCQPWKTFSFFSFISSSFYSSRFLFTGHVAAVLLSRSDRSLHAVIVLVDIIQWFQLEQPKCHEPPPACVLNSLS